MADSGHEQMLGGMAADISHIKKTTDKIESHMFGTPGNPGLEQRTARLESKDRSRTFWVRAFGTLSVGSIITYLTTHLFR